MPIVFTVVDDAILTMVDAKPKRTARLQRIVNLEAEPRAAVLADRYEEHWGRLWWVRVDVRGTVDASPHGVATTREALQVKYRQYRDHPPPGPALRFAIERWSGWAASAAAVDAGVPAPDRGPR